MSNVIIYLAAAILGKLFPFLLIPILTEALTPLEYGVWAFFLAILSFVDPLVTCSAQNYLAKNYFVKNESERGILIHNTIFIFICNFLLVSLLMGGYCLLIGSLRWEFLLIPVLSVFNSFIVLKLLILRNENSSIVFGLLEISKVGCCFSLAVFLVLFTELGWVGCVIGFLTGTLVVSLISLKSMLKCPVNAKMLNLELIKEIYKLSLPLLPVGLANVANNAADKIIIARLLGESALGIYAISYSFGQLITLFIASYIKYWGPIYYKGAANGIVSYEFIRKSSFQYIPIIAALALISYVVIDVFLFDLMVNDSFTEGKDIIPIIITALVIQGVFFFAIPFYIKTNRTKLLSLITIISAIINIGLNYILIPMFGLVGSAYSTLISYVFLSSVGHYLNVKYVKKFS